jgi:hypothetical protein
MKKVISLVIILLMLTLLAPPQKVQAHGAGWFLPGLIVGGAIGLSLAYPRYYYPPPVYYYPPPAYSYPPPAYNYPPPAYSYPPPAYVPSPLTSVPPGNVGQTPPVGGMVFLYPRQGQSQEQQVKDRDECQVWATNQSGYDPTKQPPAEMPQDQLAQGNGNFLRALGACMDGRGYTMR